MGWWGYHTNAGDCTQDEICDMTRKLNISNYGFGERLIKIGEACDSKKKQLETESNEEPNTESVEEKSTECVEVKAEALDTESADEEELEYVKKIEKEKRLKRANERLEECSDSSDDEQDKSEGHEDSDNESSEEVDGDTDEQNNNSWWNKRYEIEQYVKKNIKKLSSATFLVAGIAWELFERSLSNEGNKLPDDFPEDLRLMALESVKAYYEEMKIELMADISMCKDGDQCLVDLQEEIDVFSRKN